MQGTETRRILGSSSPVTEHYVEGAHVPRINVHLDYAKKNTHRAAKCCINDKRKKIRRTRMGNCCTTGKHGMPLQRPSFLLPQYVVVLLSGSGGVYKGNPTEAMSSIFQQELEKTAHTRRQHLLVSAQYWIQLVLYLNIWFTHFYKNRYVADCD